MTRLYLRGYIDITLDDESNALLSAFIVEHIVSRPLDEKQGWIVRRRKG